MANTYNIIWADDESSVYALKKPNGENTVLADILERKGVKLLATAKNAEELREKLTAKISWVDAVIIDANFTAFGEKPKSEYIFKGFEESVNMLRTLGDNGNRIPFILYSARELDKIQEHVEEKYLEYFIENDLYFNKDDQTISTSDVSDRLIEEVDRVNTPEHQIRCRYAEAFGAASLIEGAEDELMRCLLLEYKKDAHIDDIKDRYNAIRRVFEKMYSECKSSGLLPRMPLNSIPKLLLKEATPFELLDGEHPMHRALIEAFSFFLSIVQDGSHEDGDLNLGVIDYTTKYRTQNLLQSAVCILMDLLIWFQDASKQYNGHKFWKGNYKYEGYVEEIKARYPGGRSTYMSGIYKIEQNDKNPVEEGDFIGIKNWEDDRYNPGQKYVKARDYDIIEKYKAN